MITEGLRLESAQNPYRSEITQGYSHHRFFRICAHKSYQKLNLEIPIYVHIFVY